MLFSPREKLRGSLWLRVQTISTRYPSSSIAMACPPFTSCRREFVRMSSPRAVKTSQSQFWRADGISRHDSTSSSTGTDVVSRTVSWNEVYQRLSEAPAGRLYGIPRGGSIVAGLTGRAVDAIDDADWLVDEVIDTRATAEEWVSRVE